jgi:hypothetical protein
MKPNAAPLVSLLWYGRNILRLSCTVPVTSIADFCRFPAGRPSFNHSAAQGHANYGSVRKGRHDPFATSGLSLMPIYGALELELKQIGPNLPFSTSSKISRAVCVDSSAIWYARQRGP